MANKMKVCNHCGNEIASSAKVCPHCGARIKKPIYTRVWFWVLAVLIVACIGGGIGGSKGSSGSNSAKKETAPEKKEEITYTAVTVEELADALDKNAAAASDQYKGQYIELTGRLDNIDSDGKYIGVGVLDENDYEHMFSDVQCYIKNDDQMNIIKTMATGDEIVVKGKVTSVGEVIGYAMDIDELSAK